MKKWEIAVLIGFFAVFIILFFSFERERPWEPKTSKVEEMVMIDDTYIRVDAPLVKDSLLIDFRDDRKFNFKEYEAGDGWKFVILDIWVKNHATENRSFSAGRVEDENGMVYFTYHLEDILVGIPHLIHPYKNFVVLLPEEGEGFSIAYKMPTNAVPEKFHYSICNSHSQHGEVLLKK